MTQIIVQHFGQYKMDIMPGSILAIAFVEWTEIDDFCPLCEAHPSSGHTAECPLVRSQYSGAISDLEEVPEEIE